MNNIFVLVMLCLAVGLNAGDKASRDKQRKIDNKKELKDIASMLRIIMKLK